MRGRSEPSGPEQVRPAPHEEPLAASRLAQILSGAPALLGVVWDAWLLPDGTMERVDFANDQVERLLGYTAAEWRARPNFWGSIVHPDDHDRAQRELRDILAGGRGGASRFRWVSRGGRVVWVETQAVVALDESGRRSGMRGVTMDITERLVSEERLRYQLSFNEAITSSVAEGICTMDREGRFTSLNPVAERLLGDSRDEARGVSVHELLHVRGAQEAVHSAGACPLTEPVRTGTTRASLEDVYARRDGSRFPVLCSVAPIVLSGEVTGAVLAFNDVSERKHAEQLRGLRHRVSRILMESRRLDGTGERVLQALCEALEWDMGTLWLVDRGSSVLCCDAVWSAPSRGMAVEPGFAPGARFAPGAGLPGEVVQTRKAVAVRDFSTSKYQRAAAAGRLGLRSAFALPILLADEVVGAIELFSHALREPDPEMIEVLGDVGVHLSLFIERTRAERQVLARNQELQTMLHVISHDLREPLRGIESFSDLLRERSGDRLDEKARDYLRRILGSAGRLRRLLDDIVELARARQIEPAMGEVEGEALVGEALARLEDVIAVSHAAVRVDRPLPTLRVDRVWATQAIYNLIANALKFTRPGTVPEVEIAAYPPGSSEPIGLVVRDRGTGVGPEHQERIFQLFQRGVGRDVEGTGAGLAIVREVAARHGGNAWVIPRPGGGSEFVITFHPAESEC